MLMIGVLNFLGLIGLETAITYKNDHPYLKLLHEKFEHKFIFKFFKLNNLRGR